MERSEIIAQATSIANGASAAPAAPAQPAATAPDAKNISAILAGGGAAQPPPGAGGTAPAPDPLQSWDEVEVPKVRVQSARERLLAKAVSQQEAAKRAPIESEAAQLRNQLAAMTQREQAAAIQFREAMDKGDIDGALKVRGLDVSFEQLQRRLLESQGMLDPAHTKIAELEKQLKEREARDAEREQRLNQQRAEQQRRTEWRDAVQSTAADIASLPLPQAAEIAKIPGFAERALVKMTQDLSLTPLQAAKIVREEYSKLAQEFAVLLTPTAGGATPASPSARIAPTQPGATNQSAPPARETLADIQRQRQDIMRQASALLGGR